MAWLRSQYKEVVYLSDEERERPLFSLYLLESLSLTFMLPSFYLDLDWLLYYYRTQDFTVYLWLLRCLR